MSLAEKANRKHPEYGLVVALICMALALVIAKYSRQQLLVEFHSSDLNGADRAQVRPVTDLDGG
jgi:hypothetical protein